MRLYPSDDEWRIQESNTKTFFYRLPSKGDYRLEIQIFGKQAITLPEFKQQWVNAREEVGDEEKSSTYISYNSWQGVRVDYADCCGGLGHLDVYLKTGQDFFRVEFLYALKYFGHTNEERNRKKALQDFENIIQSLQFSN